MSRRRVSGVAVILAIAALVLSGIGALTLVVLRLGVAEGISLGPLGAVARGLDGRISRARVTVSTQDGYTRRDFSQRPEGGISPELGGEILLRTEWDLDHDGDFDCAEHLCVDDGICVSKREGGRWIRDPNVEDCFGHPVDHPHGAAQMLFR